VSRNGRQNPARPRIELTAPGATPEEAAAIAAAIEQFIRDTTPAAAAAAPTSGWQRAGIFEGAGLVADAPSPWTSPWGDSDPWGSR
jgi:hypothetical protein